MGSKTLQDMEIYNTLAFRPIQVNEVQTLDAGSLKLLGNFQRVGGIDLFGVIQALAETNR
ncbi:hypothetical protein DSECCO2_635620 [anaerobic digester metagenome]